MRAFPAIDYSLQSETEGISSLGRTRTPGPGCQPRFGTDCCVQAPYRHCPGTIQHNSTVISYSFILFRDCSAEKVCSRSLLTVAECRHADDFYSLKKITFSVDERQGLLSFWLLSSACSLGQDVFVPVRTSVLCQIFRCYIFFHSSAHSRPGLFLASLFRSQCRSFMLQNSADTL